VATAGRSIGDYLTRIESLDREPRLWSRSSPARRTPRRPGSGRSSGASGRS
jgi:hypothetical protein